MSFCKDFNSNIAVEAWNTAPRAPYETIRVSRLSPTIRADVDRLDLSRELSRLQFDEVWATQHHAIWDYYLSERAGQHVSAYPQFGSAS